jgi:hypothetical protein
MTDRSATPVLAACAVAGFLAAFAAAGLLTNRDPARPSSPSAPALAARATTLAAGATAASPLQLAPVEVPTLRRIQRKPHRVVAVATTPAAPVPTAAPAPIVTAVPVAAPQRPVVSRPARPTTPNVGQAFDSSG